MITRKLRGFIVCLTAVLSACQSPSGAKHASRPTSIELTGVISQGGLQSYFSPCSNHQQWRLDTLTPALQAQLRPSSNQPWLFKVQGYLTASSPVSQSEITLVATHLTPIQSVATLQTPCPSSAPLNPQDSGLQNSGLHNQELVGHYQTQPVNHTVITLVLHADHRAQEYYSQTPYTHARPDRTIEPTSMASTTHQSLNQRGLILSNRGFWQRLSADKVEVVMTLVQNQRITLRRVYRYRDGILTAQQESIHNQAFEIKSGLTFYPIQHHEQSHD